MTRIAITGDRHWGKDRYPAVLAAVASRIDAELFVLGDASGVDALAHAACAELDLPHIRILADWRRFGRGAGPLRNGEMLDHLTGPTDELWYFHDDLAQSKGTKNCVNQALDRGIAVRRRAINEGGSP